jgi:hypothetical protein
VGEGLFVSVLLSGVSLAVTAAVLCHRQAGGRPLSPRLLLAECTAWSAVLCFPIAMAVGNDAAARPDWYDDPSPEHRFDWAVQVAYGCGGLVLSVLPGTVLAALIRWGRHLAQPSPPAPPALPDPGPRWSDSQGTRPRTSAVRTDLRGVSEAGGTERITGRSSVSSRRGGQPTRWGSRQSALVGGGLLAVVGVAYAAGRAPSGTGCPGAVFLASLAGVTLAVAALFRSPPRGERVAGAVLLGWFVLAVVTEQFAWVGDAQGVVAAVAWLVPPAAGGVVLPRRGCWLSGLGCWAALFAGTAALTYTVSHTDSGLGLLLKWLS